MKIKLYEVLNMQKPIADLSEMKVPSRIQYWIMRNTRWIKDHVTFASSEQFKYMETYLFPNNDGSWGTADENGVITLNYKSKNDELEYQKQLDNLANMEIDIDPFILDYKKVIEENPTFELEPKYLNFLEKLIE